jgi:hypothetical protein
MIKTQKSEVRPTVVTNVVIVTLFNRIKQKKENLIVFMASVTTWRVFIFLSIKSYILGVKKINVL